MPRPLYPAAEADNFCFSSLWGFEVSRMFLWALCLYSSPSPSSPWILKHHKQLGITPRGTKCMSEGCLLAFSRINLFNLALNIILVAKYEVIHKIPKFCVNSILNSINGSNVCANSLYHKSKRSDNFTKEAQNESVWHETLIYSQNLLLASSRREKEK